MKIRDILGKGKPTLSFEVFPPKTEDKYESVEKAAMEIAAKKPSFMSVTYGAGGGNQPLYGGNCRRDSGEVRGDGFSTSDLCFFDQGKSPSSA